MISSRVVNRSNNKQATQNDLSLQILNMFENAGNDIKPISVRNQNQALQELDDIANKLDEKIDWEVQVKAINSLMGLINGGAIQYDAFIRDLIKVGTGLVSASKNLRSALVKASCMCIAQLVRELGSKFDSLGEMLLPLSSQTSHGTQIIADSCKYAMIWIVKYCQTKRVIGSIIELSKSRAVNNRVIASESFMIILSTYSKSLIDNHFNNISESVKKMLGDANSTARSFARKSVLAMEMYSPNKKYSFMQTLDERTRKQIEEEEPIAQLEDESSSSPTSEPEAPQNDIPTRLPPSNINYDDTSSISSIFSPSVPKIITRESLSSDIDSSSISNEDEYNDVKVEISVARPNMPLVKKGSYAQFVMEDQILSDSEFNTIIQSSTQKFIESHPANLVPEFSNTPPDYLKHESPHPPQSIVNPFISTPKIEQNFEQILISVSDKAVDDESDKNEFSHSEDIALKTQEPVISSPHQDQAINEIEIKPEEICETNVTEKSLEIETTPESHLSKFDSPQRIESSNDAQKLDIVTPTHDAKQETQAKQDTPEIKKTIPDQNENSTPITQKMNKEQSPLKSDRKIPVFRQSLKRNSTNASQRPLVKPRSDRLSYISPKMSIQLDEGREEDFLAKISEYTNTCRESMLEPNIKKIIPGLIVCALKGNCRTSLSALLLIKDLICEFPNHFEGSLNAIFEILFTDLAADTSEALSLIPIIINDIQSLYDCNLLMEVASHQAPSVSLLKFIKGLSMTSSIKFEESELTNEIIDIALEFIETNYDDVHSILISIAKSNVSEIVKREGIETNSTYKEMFFQIIKEIPTMEVHNHYPHFDPHSVSNWCDTMLKIAESTEEEAWNKIRLSFYHEINQSVYLTNHYDHIFKLILNLLQTKGMQDYELFLPSISKNRKNRHAYSLPELFNYIQTHTKTIKFIENLLVCAKYGEDDIICGVYDEIAHLLYDDKDPMSFNVVSSVADSLNITIQSKNPDVRKASVFCYADIFSIYGDAVLPYTQSLTFSQQKLIDLYRSIRKTM